MKEFTKENIEVYIKFFNEKCVGDQSIKYKVHNYKTKEELYENRIQMTTNNIAKKYLCDNKQEYIEAGGCFIIPPVNECEYDILLLDEKYWMYSLWHEMVHISNLLFIKSKMTVDYLDLYRAIEYSNYDEFLARAISTILLCIYFGQNNIVEYPPEIFDSTLESMLKKVPEIELAVGTVRRYNLMQYLGVVAAGCVICKDKWKMPEFVEKNKEVKKIFLKAMAWLKERRLCVL